MRYQFYTQTLALTCLLLAVNTSADAVAEQTTLTVYSDVAGAEDLLDSHYVSAIEKTLGAPSENPIYLHNNLCVAYLLSEQLSNARKACNRALKETDVRHNYGDWFQRSHSKGIRRLYRKRALAHLKMLQTVDQEFSAAKE